MKLATIGGQDPNAVAEIVRTLPDPSGLSLVIACSGAPTLGDQLLTTSRWPVIDVRESIALEPGHVYVVPPDRGVVIGPDSIVIDGARDRAVLDLLFRSAADSVGADCAAIVLAGRANEGVLGLKRVKEVGGLTICEASEHGLDHAAIASGVVDLVLPIDAISDRLAAFAAARTDVDGADNEPAIADALRDILTLVRIRTGHDFTWYKRPTLYRRIARRMHVCQTATITEYHRYLRERPSELSSLLRDFLISVTNFFRDPEAYDALARQIVPHLFANKGAADPVRVWITGCATGEEAYSIAMLLLEHNARLHEPVPIQLFATDIDEDALAEARAGRYPASIAADVSPERLERFFVHETGGYRISRELRERVLFSPHNVLRDPPFSRLDLISCRNLLIYLNREAQDRVLDVFHFGLRATGYLFLGGSESAESVTFKFASVDTKYRIFARRSSGTAQQLDAIVQAVAPWQPHPLMQTGPHLERAAASVSDLHHRLVEHYAPPSVLVNEELDIVHVGHDAGRFLTISDGEPTRQILRLVHPALRFDLRGAIYAARQPRRTTDARTVRFDDNGTTRLVELRVRAVDHLELGRGTLLILFDEVEDSRESPTTIGDPSIEPVVREMEDDLHRTRELLRTTIEQYETSVEELKASNEELHAINEELRSATEELETSKEELQSVNEELTTLNHELEAKVEELSRANSDLQNLMTSTDLGVLFLDRDCNVKRYTPRVRDIFNIIPTDLGRPLAHLTHNLETSELPALAAQVLQDLRLIEREIVSRDRKRYLVRLLPYRSLEDRIEGVVVTMVDITVLKEAQAARKRSEAALTVSEAALTVSEAAPRPRRRGCGSHFARRRS